MVLEPHSASYVTQRHAAGGPHIADLTPTHIREREAALRPEYGCGPAMHRVIDATAYHGGLQVPVRLLIPDDESDGLLVYLHGGGWVSGQLDEFDTLARNLAAGTHMTVALVDYRLAPEHPYPAAVHDCWAAIRWLSTEFPGTPLTVMGDSAGGNLAAVISQRATRAGTPSIKLQVLIYPVTDHDTTRESYLDPDNQLLLDCVGMEWFWDHYLPNRAARSEPDASPLRAPRFDGLPRTIVVVAEHDVLREEGEQYASALRNAGVPVELECFDGQMHGFFTMTNILPGSAAGQQYVIERTRNAIRQLREAPQ